MNYEGELSSSVPERAEELVFHLHHYEIVPLHFSEKKTYTIATKITLQIPFGCTSNKQKNTYNLKLVSETKALELHQCTWNKLIWMPYLLRVKKFGETARKEHGRTKQIMNLG